MFDLIWQGRMGGLRIVMVTAVALLLACGLACIYKYDPANFNRQVMWILIGTVAFIAVNLVHYRFLGQISYVLFAISLILLAIVLAGKYLFHTDQIPVINGAHRWIKFGPMQMQPSELAKLSFILALAWYLRLRSNYRRFTGLIGPFILTLLPIALILKEPDLGTVLLFLPILFTLLFIAGARIRHLSVIILLGMVMAYPFYTMMPNYQKKRIQVLLKQNTDNPNWLRNEGYQLDQSKNYIALGGLTGQGWGAEGLLRYDLPHGHNDFIFALIGHQWGLLGTSFILLLYILLIVGGIEIAAKQPEPFGRLIAVGVCTLFATQMFINIGMTIGLMPITGMTLPFVSYGGSSLVSSFLALGLLINVARHRPYKGYHQPFEFDD
jgi:rod shape determining protein RodA